MLSRLNAKERGDPLEPGFRLEDSPFFAMNQATGLYDQEMARMLRAVGVDIPRWRVLMLAHERGPISVSEVAQFALMKQPTATRVVQRMRRDGMITVDVRASDARVTDIALTAGGEVVVERIRRAASTVYADAFGEFEPEEVALLLSLLRRMHAGLQRHI
jgi:DNA-binding MarR family transcriptional regulator